MTPRFLCVGASALFAAGLFAQQPGDTFAQHQGDSRILLRYASFDPLRGKPPVPPMLESGADTNLWIVQFHGLPTEAGREAVRAAGGQIHGYLPHNAYVVRMDTGGAVGVSQAPYVRWVGAYEPAYRVDPALRATLLATADARSAPVRYDLLMVDKRNDKAALAAAIRRIGGVVVDEHHGSPLFTVDLDGLEAFAAARLDQVLWIERWQPSSEDMDNARIQGGANAVETAGGYTGAGIRGHLYEGAEATHTDFTTALTAVRSCNTADAHGHCTAGIIFGNGTSAPQARGMAPDARGYFTNRLCVTAGWSRNMVIGDVVGVHNCMFTTASWGGAVTSAYTATSADADDIVFDHRIPWTNSMSNLGNRSVRPEAWAKNVISIGGVRHFDNSDPADDSWLAGNASIGPAADGRIKPDLVAYYDAVWTSDLTGAAGYTPGNSYTAFDGTSAATPIVAGHNAIAIQMFTDHIFGNPPRVLGGTRFQNRPFAQTLKALMIAGARQYTPTATDNRRIHVGWGFPNLLDLYNARNNCFLVPETDVVTQGVTRTYYVHVGANEDELKACLTWLEPMGNPAAAQQLVNNFNLRVISPFGAIHRGNNNMLNVNYTPSGGVADTIDSVECVFVQNPDSGLWRVEVNAAAIVADAYVPTGAVDATFALAVVGAQRVSGAGCARYVDTTEPDAGTCNFIPFGVSVAQASLPTTFASNNSGSLGGVVFFDANVTTPLRLDQLALNSGAVAGTNILIDVYTVSTSYIGNETNPAAWTLRSRGEGMAAGADLPSVVQITNPFLLGAGTHGIAVVARNFIHRYTNGTGLNQSYVAPAVTLNFGAAANVFGAAAFTPRVANLEFRFAPVNTWSNQRYQTIIRRSQLGNVPGAITGLAFAPCGTGIHFNESLVVRMSHMPSGHVMSTTFANNVSAPVTVLNATNYAWDVTANTWEEIGLMNAFFYNGTSDVVVDIEARGNMLPTASAFHRDDSVPRVFASNWVAAPPATGSTDNSGTKMRVQFGCADANEYGRGCGPVTADHIGTPVLGTTWGFRASGCDPSTLVFLNLGFDNQLPLLPFDLAPFGLANCYLHNDIGATVSALANGSGVAQYGYNFPFNPAYVGAKFYGQWIAFTPAAANGISVSNHVRVVNGLAP